MPLRSFYILFLALFLAGCPRQEEPPPATATAPNVQPAATITPAPIPLLSQAVTPALVESPTEALSSWRQYASSAPALVVLANSPFLAAVPPEMDAAARRLVRNGSAEEIAKKGTALAADPVFLPGMAVRLALEAGLFSRLVWVFPVAEDAELSVEVFRQQLLDNELVNAAEAATLTMDNGHFTGTVAGRPFVATPIRQLPAIVEPVILHIDLGYFQNLYKGEIKTPLYSLLGGTLAALKEKAWPTFAVSIAASNIEGGVPLAARFVQRDLASVFAEPEILAAELPRRWQQRAQALYLENFMQKDKIRETYLAMDQATPADASIQFALYDLARQFKEGDQALQYLSKAVAADPAYALEYLHLAELADQMQLGDQAVRMLTLARSTFAANPFLMMDLARAHLQAGQTQEATELLKAAGGLAWSKVYYSHVPGLITQLLDKSE